MTRLYDLLQNFWADRSDRYRPVVLWDFVVSFLEHWDDMCNVHASRDEEKFADGMRVCIFFSDTSSRRIPSKLYGEVRPGRKPCENLRREKFRDLRTRSLDKSNLDIVSIRCLGKPVHSQVTRLAGKGATKPLGSASVVRYDVIDRLQN